MLLYHQHEGDRPARHGIGHRLSVLMVAVVILSLGHRHHPPLLCVLLAGGGQRPLPSSRRGTLGHVLGDVLDQVTDALDLAQDALHAMVNGLGIRLEDILRDAK